MRACVCVVLCCVVLCCVCMYVCLKTREMSGRVTPVLYRYKLGWNNLSSSMDRSKKIGALCNSHNIDPAKWDNYNFSCFPLPDIVPNEYLPHSAVILARVLYS
jgi:hypothetical protein